MHEQVAHGASGDRAFVADELYGRTNQKPAIITRHQISVWTKHDVRERRRRQFELDDLATRRNDLARWQSESVDQARPYTRDELPLLGRTRIERLFLSTGHYRNGILLAPLSAQIVRAAVLGQRAPVSLEAFSPERGPNPVLREAPPR